MPEHIINIVMVLFYIATSLQRGKFGVTHGFFIEMVFIVFGF